jgi:hypothetical protein
MPKQLGNIIYKTQPQGTQGNETLRTAPYYPQACLRQRVWCRKGESKRLKERPAPKIRLALLSHEHGDLETTNTTTSERLSPRTIPYNTHIL